MSLVLLHVVMLYLIVVQPVLGATRYRRRQAAIAEHRGRFYVQSVAFKWLWTGVIGFAAFRVAAPEALGLVAPPEARWPGTIALAAAAVAYVALRSRRAAVPQAIAPLLPVTAPERWLWALLAVTAGITEEFVYRGVMLYYFQSLGLPLLAAAAAQAVAFGLAHTYQGWRGGVRTGTMAAYFAALYVYSGSIVAAMAVHALVDLAALLRRGEPAPA